MKKNIKLGVIGIHGKMGKAIMTESLLHEDVDIVAGATTKKRSTEISNDTNNYAYQKIILSTQIEEVFEYSDVVLDFTNPETMKICIEVAMKSKKPLVSGTTGHDNYSLLKNASMHIPVFWAPNMSQGMKIIMHMLKSAAPIVPKDVDAAILEIHHTQKKDLPSGTSLELKNCVEGMINKQISISSLRIKDISGMHSVFFSFMDESIEIKHCVNSRKSFAKGAINAAKWLHTQSNGLYSMSDLVESKNYG